LLCGRTIRNHQRILDAVMNTLRRAIDERLTAVGQYRFGIKTPIESLHAEDVYGLI
jgi:hypothetical protein